jgi:hypothetical protein
LAGRAVRGLLGVLVALALAPSAVRAAPPVCDGPPPLPAEAQARPLVIFGELHGTREAPALVAQHVCALLATGRTVRVGLEIPVDEQPAIDRYLASPGRPADRAALLSGYFWQRPMQDGRTSVAMASLIERLRAWREATGRVAVVALDGQRGMSREEGLADAVRRMRLRSPQAAHVVLTGNVHARTVPGLPDGDPGFEPMASRLRDLAPLAVRIDFRDGGSAWNCQSSCESHRLHADRREPPATLGYAAADDPAYDAVLRLATASPSTPAVGR